MSCWLDAVVILLQLAHFCAFGRCSALGAPGCVHIGEGMGSRWVNACSRDIFVASFIASLRKRGKAHKICPILPVHTKTHIIFMHSLSRLVFHPWTFLVSYHISQRLNLENSHDKLSVTESPKRSSYHERVQSIRMSKTCWACLLSSVFKIDKNVR